MLNIAETFTDGCLPRRTWRRRVSLVRWLTV